MKKTILSSLAICAALLGCQKSETSESLSSPDTLHATIEETSTKTAMDADNNILWSADDQVIAFMKSSYGHQYKLVSSFVGKTYADFEPVSSSGDNLSAGTVWNHNVVYYPYSADVEALKSGSNYNLSVALPSEQTYAPESFGSGSFPMVAVSENNNITFRNVLGGMKLQLKGTQKVMSITLQGKNNEKLSGAATVTAYTDGETNPAITIASSASTSVTLNCGSGVQLNESTATEFIIALPPMVFSKGFTVTVTDDADKTYTVETDKANTVLRSSILNMPAVLLGNSEGGESGDEGDEELFVPVSYVKLDYYNVKLYEGFTAQLNSVVGPRDATDKTVVWSSADSAVASVDQTGLVTALAAGSTEILATAGGQVATCTITIPNLRIIDYIDEYGVNHGRGIPVENLVWAPVNCGYHETDYPYGKLYQWGRKYGQGYSGPLYDIYDKYVGEISDATVPTIEDGGISVVSGNHKTKSNVFYIGTYAYNFDWVDPQDDKLWNSSTESNPIKTKYDPCPEGWRVPTYDELKDLNQNHSSWTTKEDSQTGYWFSATESYLRIVPQVFFPAAGYRIGDEGGAVDRGRCGYYWSSSWGNGSAAYINFNCSYVSGYVISRAYGLSVRCVQE